MMMKTMSAQVCHTLNYLIVSDYKLTITAALESESAQAGHKRKTTKSLSASSAKKPKTLDEVQGNVTMFPSGKFCLLKIYAFL